MSLVYGAAALTLAVLVYQLLYHVHRFDPVPRWAEHPLTGGGLLQVSLWSGAFGVAFLLKGVLFAADSGGLLAAAIGGGELAVVAAVGVGLFVLQRRLFQQRRAAGHAADTAPLGPGAPRTPQPANDQRRRRRAA